MNLLSKMIYKLAYIKAEKQNKALWHDLCEKMDFDKEVRKNCAEEFLNIVRPLVNMATIEHKQNTCNEIVITINKNCKCSIENNGIGIDGNTLKITPLSIAETMNDNNGEDFINNLLSIVEDQNEPDFDQFEIVENKQLDTFLDENTILGNLKSSILHCNDYFEIISDFQNQRYSKKLTPMLLGLSKFKNCGKINKSGLTVVFKSNLLHNNMFGYDEVLDLAEQTVKENTGLKISIIDKRNKLYKQFI